MMSATLRDIKTFDKETEVTCAVCGKKLSINFVEPCPCCESIAKKYVKICEEPVYWEDSVGWRRQKNYKEKNLLLLGLNIFVIIYSVFITSALQGLLGLVLGILLGVASSVIGFYAVTKVKEIRESGSL